ncbi:MAG: Hpt domain-containing protein [Bacteroidetes bacterium]|nr:Hpt domain-containing protein [Bacteroidota bacterium]MBL6944346.1 Hpt domain-containing protein [Bacteroidales bacterium]
MGYINREQFLENFQYFDKEIVVEIIDLFITEFPDRLKTISDNIESVDFNNLKFNAHSLKGVIANFIAPEVEEEARKLEMMGNKNNIDGARKLFEEFKVSCGLMIDELIELKEQFK